MCMYRIYVHAYAHVCVSVCVRACVRVCVFPYCGEDIICQKNISQMTVLLIKFGDIIAIPSNDL